MNILFGLLTLAILALEPARPRSRSITMDCPADMAPHEVCVFTDSSKIIAVNPTTEPVRVVIQIQRIENVELVYRYPFVEDLPANSSRTLIKYRVVKSEKPYALDYEWGWAKR